MNDNRDITEIYRLVKVLKVDTTGTVFEGEHPASGEPVAIKLIEGRAEQPEQRALFERMMSALQAIQHPTLPRCVEHGFTSAGSAYVVWELLEGVRLEDIVDSDVIRRASRLADVATGLQQLHAADIVHGNLATENVFVVSGEEGVERAVLLGIGSWVFRAGDQGAHIPSRYIAPERLGSAGGAMTVAAPADLYALGIIACELLELTVASATGPRPTVAFAPTALVADSREAGLALAGTLERCLRRAPEQRPEPQEVVVALERFATALQESTSGRELTHMGDGSSVPAAPPPLPGAAPVEPTMVLSRPAMEEMIASEEKDVEPAVPTPPPMTEEAAEHDPATTIMDRSEIAAAANGLAQETNGDSRDAGEAASVEPPASAADEGAASTTGTVVLSRQEISRARQSEAMKAAPDPVDSSDESLEASSEDTAPEATVIMERPGPAAAADEDEGSSAQEWELDSTPAPAPPFEVMPPEEIEAPDWELESEATMSMPLPTQAEPKSPPPVSSPPSGDDSGTQPMTQPSSQTAPPPVAEKMVAYADSEEFDPNCTLAVSFEGDDQQKEHQPERAPTSDNLEQVTDAPPDSDLGPDVETSGGEPEPVSPVEPSPARGGEAEVHVAESELPPQEPPSVPVEAEPPPTPELPPEPPTVPVEPVTPPVAAPVEGTPPPTPESPPIPESPASSHSPAPPQPPPMADAEEPPPPVAAPPVPPAPAKEPASSTAPAAPPQSPKTEPPNLEGVTVAPAPRPQQSSSRRPWLLWAGVALVVIVVAVGAVVVLTGGDDQPETPPQPVEPVAVVEPTPVLPTPAPMVEEDLEEAVELYPALVVAQEAMAAGDTEAARAALEQIPEDVVDSFGEDDFDVYQELVDVFAGAEQNRLEQAIRTLQRGLKIDSPKLLRRAMGVLEHEDPSALADRPELLNDMNHARRALEVRDLMWAAHRNERSEEVLEHAATLKALLPGYSRIPELRGAAAQRIEAEAQAAEAAGNLRQAIARLEVIGSTWPDRPGLSERIDRLRGLQQENERLSSVLQRLRAFEEQRQPEEGLALLDQVQPSPRFADEFTAARQRLLRLRTEMDQQAPTVELTDGADLDFRKNDVVTITFRVADDLRVESVVGYRRGEGESGYQDLPLQRLGEDLWSCTIGPEIHDNRTLEFYVVVTDPSGHRGTLGSAEEPIVLKRKKWFQS